MKTGMTMFLGILGLGFALFAPLPSLAMPNPAAVYCAEHGGSGVGVIESAGEFSLCRLSDGSMIEQWTFFRQESKPDDDIFSAPAKMGRDMPTAVVKFLDAQKHAYDGVPAEDWDGKNCVEQGGAFRTYSGYNDTETYSLCRFADNSLIEAQTLMLGPERYPELAKQLIHP